MVQNVHTVLDEPKLHHAQVNVITDDWGDKQEFYHIKSPGHLCAAKSHTDVLQDHPLPWKGIPNIVNLPNAAEEGFEQCHYVLPR